MVYVQHALASTCMRNVDLKDQTVDADDEELRRLLWRRKVGFGCPGTATHNGPLRYTLLWLLTNANVGVSGVYTLELRFTSLCLCCLRLAFLGSLLNGID